MNEQRNRASTSVPTLDQQAVQRQQRGNLRIFLGYMIGVGKTYAMLDAGQQHQANGIDVVVACAEPRGFAEIETMQHSLEQIAASMVASDQTTVHLDALLARRPALVLVDDLAHSNPPGVRHPKRWQDVEELLDAGIDVYTTLNIYQLESLNDVVSHITGIKVNETVPDWILDHADVEVIDLSVAELLHRLDEGKIDLSRYNGITPTKFFRPGNLNALRELALRCAAERVDHQLRAYMQVQAIPGPWAVHERIMVCVSPSPLGERLVRAARRLAARLDAEWCAVYVTTPAHAAMRAVESEQVTHTLRLAEELGGKAITISATSVVNGLVEYARAHNINKIIAGKPLRPRWRELWRGSLVDRLIRTGTEIDVYVISSALQRADAEAVPRTQLPGAPNKLHRGYLWSAGIVLLITILGLPLRAHVAPTNLVMLYLMAIVITALQWGRGPSIVASLFSVLAFDVIFVPPYYTMAVSDAEYLLTFSGLFIVGIVVSTLAARTRSQAAAAREREEQAVTAFELSSDLATAVTIEEICERALLHTQQVFEAAVAIFLPTVTGLVPMYATRDYLDDSHNLEVAGWAFSHGKAAGVGTNTMPSALVRAVPLMTADKTVGVMAVRLPPAHLLPAQRRLLESFANQIALALERAQLAEAASELRLVQEREKFQTALLGSISHDLRTPLVSITGALSVLQEQETVLPLQARQSLVTTAYEQATRLNQLVGNLLDMSRLEGGVIQIRRELCDLQDLVGAALERNAALLAQHNVVFDVPDTLPLIPLDFVLMVQVLANLIDNAAKYSPPHTTIALRAHCREEEVEIVVADEGRGIPPEALTQIFAKFYRVTHGDSVVGTGLGLSICKGLVEAHGGTISAANRPEGGSLFTVVLPLAQVEEGAVTA